MRTIDLIPESYRSYIRAKRTLQQATIILVLLLTTALFAFAYVHKQLAAENQQLLSLRKKANDLAALRSQITEMQEKKRQIETDATMLQQLRGQGEVMMAITALDQALNEGVWLSHFLYKRVHHIDNSNPSPSGGHQAQTDVIHVGANKFDNKAAPAELAYSRIELKGASINHDALSNFFKVMSQQQGISSMRFLNSSVQSDEEKQVMHFSADAIVRSKGKQL